MRFLRRNKKKNKGESQKYQNKKPCRNCGKLMPRGNPYCYSCGTNQKTGEVDSAFNFKRQTPSLLAISYGGKVTQEGLKCVRCKSAEDLEYYNMSESFKKKERSVPITKVYTARPSFNFPTCSNCARSFRNWKKLKWVFIIVVLLWVFLSIPVYRTLSIGFFITYASIAIIIVIISFALFTRLKSNPNRWMKISGIFSKIDKGFIYKGYVKPPNSKEWIDYDKWIEEIKKE